MVKFLRVIFFCWEGDVFVGGKKGEKLIKDRSGFES